MTTEIPENKTSLPSYLKELEELEKEATPGPWNDFTYGDDHFGRWLKLYLRKDHSEGFQSREMTRFDHDICVVLRNKLPRIIEDFKRLQKELAEARKDKADLIKENKILRKKNDKQTN